jgi:DNA-directed RNA polymerase subunit M/transcription elongation factor TFIIS
MKESPFCESCGKILNMNVENEVIVAKCDCGFSKTLTSFTFSEKNKPVSIIGNGIFNETETSSYYPHICEKCGHNEANAYDIGVQYSDEANILVYRCKKCHHIERQADGTSNN